MYENRLLHKFVQEKKTRQKSELLIHKLVLEELHYKRLFKLFEKLKTEQGKMGVRKTHVFKTMPVKRHLRRRLKPIRYERIIY